MFVHRLIAELALVILTLWLQSAGIAALVAWVRHKLRGDTRQIGGLRSASLVVRLTTAVVVLHGLEILVWASFYRWRCLPSWDSAVYFSASSYSTLGCNDVSLPSNWRTLAPLESIIGVLMCGISVSLLFAIVTRLINRDERSRNDYHATAVAPTRVGGTPREGGPQQNSTCGAGGSEVHLSLSERAR